MFSSAKKIKDFDTFWNTLFDSIELRAAKETNPKLSNVNPKKEFSLVLKKS